MHERIVIGGTELTGTEAARRFTPDELREGLLQEGFSRFPVEAWSAVSTSVEQVVAYLYGGAR